MASSSSSSSTSWKYDVFLSFRGEDTRNTFVGHLYHALEQHGILTYKDDVTLDRGDTIGPSLLKAIEESQILVIIFSENYADSSWCLDELSHIMKCKDKVTGQIVFPIFYHVDPSDVRKQKRKYEEAFAKHELSENKNKVESWKKALIDASKIAGWEPKRVANGQEARCIQEIVGSILGKLSFLDSSVEGENLVGMETRLQLLKSHLRIESGGVRMVGIWGVGGGGKTTLATSLYKELKISGQFHGCCFVENIREESKRQHGLKGLQEKILSTVFDKKMQVESVELGKDMIKQMLCRRNVLIVLDDVDHLDQLEALAGYHNWFGNGSRIIITTRDEQVLKSHRVDEVCPVSLLSQDEAIRLFKRHAYQEHNPVEDYDKLSLVVITYVNGLPLALKILGAFLYGKDKDEWISTLARLKDHPEMGILEQLKISFDGLKDVEKELFLDIACFFRSESWRIDEPMEILDACGFHPRIGVKVLIQKALITVSKNGEFDMHDLVQEMGHYIVRGKPPYNPEEHSRVWRTEDIEDICSKVATMENDKIEALHYKDNSTNGCTFNLIRHVSNMKKLRFLRVERDFFSKVTRVTTTSFNEGPGFLSNELRYISWDGYPACLFQFPESFQSRKLVFLKLSRGFQKELWKGYKHLPCLKKLELFDAMELVRTPDLSGLPCLQELCFLYCDSLEEIHQSLGNHASLVKVIVVSCNKLTRFPTIVKMNKLKVLRFEKCRALNEFPKIEANMDSLVELSLERVGIEVLPSSIGEYCINLTLLRLNACSKLKSIDGNFHALKGLKYFELAGCNQFEKSPKDLFNENLDGLDLMLDSSIKQLIPSSMPSFLTELNLSWDGLKDGDIPNEIGELSNLRELLLFIKNITRLDFSLSQLTRLKLLQLSCSESLVELPEFPSSLAILQANCCELLEVINDDAYRRCKWLCTVSILPGFEQGEIITGGVTGGQRLLESMLQGKAVKSGCMILKLKGLEIPRGFEPRLVRGERCRMQVPENWHNHFSGFLFCVVLHHYSPNTSSEYDEVINIITRMKHEKLTGDSMRMQDSQDYVFSEETDDDDDEADDEDDYYDDDYGSKCTWVGYIPFASLRNTSWWEDQTSTAIAIEFDLCESDLRATIGGCGIKLIPRRSETSIADSSSFEDVSNEYTCALNILHDSESTFKFYISNDKLL